MIIMLQFTDPEKQSTKQGSSQDMWGRGKRIDFANGSRAGGDRKRRDLIGWEKWMAGYLER